MEENVKYINRITIAGVTYKLRAEVVEVNPIVCPKCGSSFEIVDGKGRCEYCGTNYSIRYKIEEDNS